MEPKPFLLLWLSPTDQSKNVFKHLSGSEPLAGVRYCYLCALQKLFVLSVDGVEGTADVEINLKSK